MNNVIFDLSKENASLLHCENKRGFYFVQDGLLYGKIESAFPEQFTVLFSFILSNNYDRNALVFEFGNWDEKNGFGIYINNNKQITFRVNDNYDNYVEINTKIVPEQLYNISIIKDGDGLKFFINNELKYTCTDKVNPFDVYGAFNRFATVGNKNERISGYLSNVLVYDSVLTQQEIDDVFQTFVETDFDCPSCGAKTSFPQFVNFLLNPKGNETKNNELIEYDVCTKCNTVFSSEMMNWSQEQFLEKCYNKNYIVYDADFVNPISGRVTTIAEYIKNNFNTSIRHLDYGCGQGYLVKHLKGLGYENSFGYDLYANNGTQELLNQKYDLITCVEVVEHASNVNEIFDSFAKMLNPDGQLIITTLFHNKQRLGDWWYCNPRVGHILFFTEQGFKSFALKHGFQIQKIDNFQSQKIIILKKIIKQAKTKKNK